MEFKLPSLAFIRRFWYLTCLRLFIPHEFIILNLISASFGIAMRYFSHIPLGFCKFKVDILGLVYVRPKDFKHQFLWEPHLFTQIKVFILCTQNLSSSFFFFLEPFFLIIRGFYFLLSNFTCKLKFLKPKSFESMESSSANSAA